MEIKDQQRAAIKAWYLQLVRGGAWVFVALLLPVILGRKLGYLYSANRFNIMWMITSLIFVGYATASTWYEWRQLQWVRRLDHVLTLREFRIAKAREKYHHSVLLAIVFVCWFGVSLPFFHTSVLWLPLAGAIAGMFRFRSEFRELERG